MIFLVYTWIYKRGFLGFYKCKISFLPWPILMHFAFQICLFSPLIPRPYVILTPIFLFQNIIIFFLGHDNCVTLSLVYFLKILLSIFCLKQLFCLQFVFCHFSVIVSLAYIYLTVLENVYLYTYLI